MGKETENQIADLDRPGRRLIGGASAFYAAAGLLYKHFTDKLPWATVLVNLSFSIELALKGYLREKGLSEEDQKDIGHDLIRALDEAERLGFKPSQSYRELLTDLSTLNKNMSLRYLTDNPTIQKLPRIEIVIHLTNLLFKDVVRQAAVPGEPGWSL